MTNIKNDHDYAWETRLLELGFEIQKHVREQMAVAGPAMSVPVAQEAGDTIYAIDRHVEGVIDAAIRFWPEACKPLMLVAEGMPNDGVMLYGEDSRDVRYKVIIDPIDGTRSLMYDKRSAWFLGAVVSGSDDTAGVADASLAVMVELPTSKQAFGDYFVAKQNQQARGRRRRLDGQEEWDIDVRPSQATTLKDGFASVSNFFRGTKMIASELMERIGERVLGEQVAGRADMFDDQYISTGGQMVELMLGRDRFCCDLRPVFHAIARREGQTVSGIECHPYDIAGMLVARQAGVVLTDCFGRALNAPLDIYRGVHWCGYGNEMLRQQIEPVILEWLGEKQVTPDLLDHCKIDNTNEGPDVGVRVL